MRPLGSGQQRVAVIQILGTLSRFGEYGGTSVSEATAAVRRAAADDSIAHLLLYVSSPGGHVFGLDDLASAVYEARQRKTVTAVVEDFGASGAYYVASQATRVYANRSAMVGSIGTFATVIDASDAMSQMGIKVYVVRSSAMKGSGQRGSKVTPEELADVQRLVDALAAQFVEAVMRGRAMNQKQAEAVSTGQVWLAEEAKKLRLIDGVATLDEVLGAVLRTLPAPPSSTVASTVTPSASAGTSPLYVSDRFGAHRPLTPDEIKRFDVSVSTPRAMSAAASTPVVKGSRMSPTEIASTIDSFESKVNALVAAGMPRERATSAVVKKHPELHAAHIRAFNAKHGRTALGRFA
jgi:protease-4